METPIETFNLDDHVVNIYLDPEPDNPRSWDNAATMYCQHGRYTLGDKDAEPPEADDVVLPLYLYDHSGLTMSTSPFSCPWDSGQVGVIYMSRGAIRRVFGVQRITSKVMDRAIALMESEVKSYDKYLRGEAYGYSIEDVNGIPFDSCWGFDDLQACREDAVLAAKA